MCGRLKSNKNERQCAETVAMLNRFSGERTWLTWEGGKKDQSLSELYACEQLQVRKRSASILKPGNVQTFYWKKLESQ